MQANSKFIDNSQGFSCNLPFRSRFIRDILDGRWFHSLGGLLDLGIESIVNGVAGLCSGLGVTRAIDLVIGVFRGIAAGISGFDRVCERTSTVLGRASDTQP